ncbi:MAG: hypothetical protein HY721_05565 [Planctomycetes bacterium]|nr:hypothetical protein [Planctomycetota bacterium]
MRLPPVVALGALVLLVSPAPFAAADGEARPRPFALGFTPFPPDTTTEAVEDTYRFVGATGDLIVHHLDDGVAWPESLEGKPFHANLGADWERRARASKGKRVFLAVTPLDGGRRDLALYRGSRDNMPLPAEMRGKALDDPAVRLAFLAWCRRAVQRLQPDWLAGGIEVKSPSPRPASLPRR